MQNDPIPNLTSILKLKEGYRNYPIDFYHKLHDDLYEDIRYHCLAGDNYYHRTDNPPYFEQIKYSIPYLYLRNSIIKKLKAINEVLGQSKLELYFFDCYRPIEVQNYFHDTWVPNRLRQDHPDWPKEKILREVDNYWAKGAPSSSEVDPNSPPPHSTGAAFDLTIRKQSGEHLFMGSIFDDASEISNTDYFERKLSKQEPSFSDSEALKNRRLLYWLMIDAGFANNPTEWWHYSWGDQMWAKLTNQPAAFYSSLDIDS